MILTFAGIFLASAGLILYVGLAAYSQLDDQEDI